MTTFIHTADWQLGKPFARVEDFSKKARLQQERILVLQRIAEAVIEYQPEFVLVAGDVFDSSTPTKHTVAAACGAIGAMRVPVYAIPGNHDHGGPGCIWEQPFFVRERQALAPNLVVLTASDPFETDQIVLFPCPLLRRHESADPTVWLRLIRHDELSRFGSKPRVVLAHGSVQGFGSPVDDDESIEGGTNQIDLSRLPHGVFDYIALGDWHGTKRITDNAWYSGTPERDRFPKGDSNEPGHILIVRTERGLPVDVERIRTARLNWHELSFHFAEDRAVEELQQRLQEMFGLRTDEDLLRLDVSGSLGLIARDRFDELLESVDARLLRVKLSGEVKVAPTSGEIESFTMRTADPVTSRVARELLVLASGNGEEADVARIALRQLHAACHST